MPLTVYDDILCGLPQKAYQKAHIIQTLEFKELAERFLRNIPRFIQ